MSTQRYILILTLFLLHRVLDLIPLLPLTRSLFTHENHSRPEAVRLREKGKIKKKFNGLNLRVMPNLCSSAYVIEGDAKEIKSTCLDVVFISHLYIINLTKSI